MLPDYLVIGGVEVISTSRAAAYAALGECGVPTGCDWCPEEVGVWLNMGQEYRGITEDPAPWYDPAVPESASIYGIVATEVTGMSTRVGSGRTANGSRSAALRQFTVRLAIVLGDECARDYAHGWLANAFGPSACDDACRGQDVCMLTCCPEIDPDTGELVGPDPLRYLYGVETVSGPSLVSEQYADDEVLLVYDVTLATSNYWVWRQPTSERTIMVRPSDGEPVTVDLIEAYEACPDDDECALPAECEPNQFAPLPPEPLPRCYPADPFNALRTVVQIPSTVMPSGVDVVPVVRVEAGNAPLRNLVVRFFNNPLDIPCDRLADLNPCRACTDLTVSEVPARATLTMDGRTGLNRYSCPNSRGAPVEKPATVYGPPIDGAGAGYIDAIACGVGLCVEIYAAEGVAANAKVEIEFWTRTNGA